MAGVLALAGSPAVAAASQLRFDGSTLTYSAAPGEFNAVLLSVVTLGSGERVVNVEEYGDRADAAPIRIEAISPCERLGGPSRRAAPQAHPQPEYAQCPLASATRIELGDLSDGLSVRSSLDSRDTAIGGEGNDNIYSGRGADVLDGGPGDDGLSGDSEADTLIGGPGNDIARYEEFSRTSGVVVDVGGGPNDGNNEDGPPGARDDVGPDVEGISGSRFDDTLVGDAGPNLLLGGDGADSLDGRSGDDELEGGEGADSLQGGGGNDRIRGDEGADVVEGGDGDDTLTGGEGADRLSGGAGEDVLASRDAAADVVACGAGGDAVTADALDTVADDCEQIDRGRGPPSPPTPGPVDPGDTTGPSVAVGRRTRISRGRLLLSLRCPAAESGGCSGAVRLAAGRLTLGRQAFQAAAGRTATVRVRLSAAGRRLLGRTRRLRVRVTVQARDAAGNPRLTRVTRTVRLRR